MQVAVEGQRPKAFAEFRVWVDLGGNRCKREHRSGAKEIVLASAIPPPSSEERPEPLPHGACPAGRIAAQFRSIEAGG